MQMKLHHTYARTTSHPAASGMCPPKWLTAGANEAGGHAQASPRDERRNACTKGRGEQGGVEDERVRR